MTTVFPASSDNRARLRAAPELGLSAEQLDLIFDYSFYTKHAAMVLARVEAAAGVVSTPAD